MVLIYIKRRLFRNQYLLAFIGITFTIYIFSQINILEDVQSPVHYVEANPAKHVTNTSHLVYYKRDTPIVWIGGVPRSGTTLMRDILDAHSDIECGLETRVIPRILGMHAGISKSEVEMSRLLEAHITEAVLNEALGAYVVSVLASHATRRGGRTLCNKDPFTLRSMSRLLKTLPASKFVLMVRDGRATAHSIIANHVTIKGFDVTTYQGALRDWNRTISALYEDCIHHGRATCLPVYYEHLVLRPRHETRRVLQFLGLPWEDSILTQIQSSDYAFGARDSLYSWVEHIPVEVRNSMAEIAPMLRTLGYDPGAYPPDYDKLPPSAHMESSWTTKH